MYLDIYEAIEHRHLLQFYYGHYFRIVEPHAYGSDSRGKDALKAYQVAGADALGAHKGWKWYDPKQMDHVRVLPTVFVPRRDTFNLGDKRLLRIYCQVPGPARAHVPRAQQSDRR